MWQSPPIEFPVNGLYAGELKGTVKRGGKKKMLPSNKELQETATREERRALELRSNESIHCAFGKHTNEPTNQPKGTVG